MRHPIMKVKKLSVVFLLLLLCAGFFVTCSDPLTELGLTGARTLNQRSRTQLLSEMTEKECVEFIIKKGVAIPPMFANLPNLGTLAKHLVNVVEANPNYLNTHSSRIMHDFVNSIIRVVNDYYGVTRRNTSRNTDEPYVLKHNLVRNHSGQWVSSGGAWHISYDRYNCYSYAIGITNGFVEPGYHSGSENLFGFTASYLAELVEADLVSLGYSNVSITSIAPDPLTLGPDENLICVREGGFLIDDEIISTDFHFMKYNDGYWYHKPGNTAPLKYLHHPSDGKVLNNFISEYVWNVEISSFRDFYGPFGFEGVRDDGFCYFGDIYYITYSMLSWLPPVTIDVDKFYLPAPVDAFTPHTFIFTSQYTGTVTWADHNGVPLGSGAAFAAGIQYTATISLIPEPGHTLYNVSLNFFKVDGAATSNAANIGVITAVFPSAPSTIDLVIQGVPVPRVGAVPVKTINETQYTGTVGWYPKDPVFNAGVHYTASITLYPKANYTLVGIDYNSFIVQGAELTSYTITNVHSITALFPPPLLE